MHIPFSIWGKHNLPDFGLALFPPGQNFCMKLWTVCWSLLLLLSSVFCCAWWASFSIIALMSPYNLLIAWSTAEASSNLSFWNKGLIQWQPPLHTFVQVEEVVCSIPKLSFVEVACLDLACMNAGGAMSWGLSLIWRHTSPLSLEKMAEIASKMTYWHFVICKKAH